MNLAAESAQERDVWINAFKNSLEDITSRKQRDNNHSQIVHVTHESAIVIYSHKNDSEHKDDLDCEPRRKPTMYYTSDYKHVEGWLLKEDPTTGSWRRRYFVLQDSRLWYYEMSLKGSVPLAQGAGIYATDHRSTLNHEDATFGGFMSQSNFSFRLNVTENERIYQLAADTEEDQKYWIDAVQACIRDAKHFQPNESQQNEEKMMDDMAIYTLAYHQEAPEGSVTFVFTDVQNSTKLWETEPDAMNEGLELHDEVLRRLLKKFRGYEVKTEGDAFMVTFFSSKDALLWCIAVQRELLKLNWPQPLLTLPASCKEFSKEDEKEMIYSGIRIRMGIHTGKPNCRRNPVTGRMDYFGPVVNRSARVSDSAHGGQIICTQEVYEEIRKVQDENQLHENIVIHDLGEFPYKGIGSLVKIYQVLPTDLAARHPFPPLRIGHKEKAASTSASSSTINTTTEEAED